MTANRRVALVSRDADERHKLADYLISAGFEIDECTDLALPAGYFAVVMITRDDTTPEALEAQVRSWIKLGKLQRVVVVTSKPAALRALVAAHTARLFVLAAPAFGWDVVDALRPVVPGSLPRGP